MDNRIKHGHAPHGKPTSTYVIWMGMIQRCGNPKAKDFARYGGRGIKICDRWQGAPQGFLNFLEDMGRRPEGLMLDRIDNDGDYRPGNCRWVTPKQQSQNTRKALRITIGNETLCGREWARRLGISQPLLHWRAEKTWILFSRCHSLSGTQLMPEGVDKLRRKLVDVLPKQARAQMEVAMTESAALIAAGARLRVPVDLGKLRDSIHTTEVREGKRGGLYVAITAGERTKNNYNTARIVEFGTMDTPAQPFLLPSYRANRKRAVRRMRKAITDAIRKAGLA